MAGRKPRTETMTEQAPITETDEFKSAVAAATQAAIAAAIPTIIAQLSQAKGAVPVSEGDQSWANGLAMAIAALNDQGSGRKRIAPEIVKQRDEAREEMVRRLVAAKAAGETPLYTLRNKVYLDEILIEPIYMDSATKSPRPTEIGWPSVPSEAMIPVNEVAKGIFEMFSKSIGSVEWQKKPDTFGITVGGLVVKNGAVQPKRAVPSADGHIKTEGLTISHRGGDKNFKEIPVLGTVAAPARQAI
jgi:hypothetical protein